MQTEQDERQAEQGEWREQEALRREIALLKAAAPGMCRIEPGDLVALVEVAEG